MQQRDAIDWYNEGIALHISGDRDGAIRCYDHALEIDPEYAAIWGSKGIALYELGRYDGVIQCYDHALEIDPGDTLAKSNREGALKKRGATAKESDRGASI